MTAAAGFDAADGNTMIRWVAVIFIGLVIFPLLFPALEKLGIGRAPGDVRFRVRSLILCLPFGSTLIVSALAFLAAEIIHRL
jgi:glycopeptide antibiotics resistance protein